MPSDVSLKTTVQVGDHEITKEQFLRALELLFHHGDAFVFDPLLSTDRRVESVAMNGTAIQIFLSEDDDD